MILLKNHIFYLRLREMPWTALAEINMLASFFHHPFRHFRSRKAKGPFSVQANPTFTLCDLSAAFLCNTAPESGCIGFRCITLQ